LNARIATFAAVLVFIAGFAVLTVAAAVRDGVTLLTLVSVLVLALFGCGIVGALRNPPPDE
jgi:hypothetical protein